MQHVEEDDALPGQDSFIDVVCNMVGILIVLVMIVGVRASSASSSPEAKPSYRTGTGHKAADVQLLAELSNSRKQLALTHRQVNDAVQQSLELDVQSRLVEAQRAQLELVKTAVERDIEVRRANLSAEGQRQFDVQRQIAEAGIKLQQLMEQQVALTSGSASVETIESVPTPIAHEATGELVTVRLRHGRLAIVPEEKLVREVVARGPDYIRNCLSRRDYAEEWFGPIDGFRMQLIVARSGDPRLPGDTRTPMGERRIVWGTFFIPTSDEIGETMEQALLPNSTFMRELRAGRSAVPVVKSYVYGDSYDEFRHLKRALWTTGTSLSIVPVFGDDPIGVAYGTEGYRAVAQ